MESSSPFLFNERLIFGNPHSHVAICTLWTQIKEYEKTIPKELFTVMGQLYSHSGHGVAIIARNILSHPHIRTIIICGQDRSGSKKCLLEWKISDCVLEKEHEAMDYLRKYITFVEIPAGNQSTLKSTLEKLAAVGNPLHFVDRDPCIFPLPESKKQQECLPSEQSGMRVCGLSIDELWRKALTQVLRYGTDKANFRELYCLISLLDGNQSTMPCSKEECDRYIENGEWLQKNPHPPSGISYTYAHRIRKHFVDGDQIDRAVQQLRENSSARYAYISLWDHEKDSKGKETPCLVSLQLFLSPPATLHMQAHFRSHDIGQAYPLNLYALRELQKQIVQENISEKWQLGTLTIISSSAHIYDYFIEEAKLAASTRTVCMWDKRGNVSVSFDRATKQLVASLYSRYGEWLCDYKGQTAHEVIDKMLLDDCLSSAGNWTWVALELATVEKMINNNNT